jgi:hypothetical protein
MKPGLAGIMLLQCTQIGIDAAIRKITYALDRWCPSDEMLADVTYCRPLLLAASSFPIDTKRTLSGW